MFELNKTTSETSTLSDSDEHQESDDQLSNLPLSIIHDILERVPIRDVVRTSLLSRQWRYTWVTLPRILFREYDDELDWQSAPDNPKLKEFGENINKFITRVLQLHKGPINGFEMVYPYYFGVPNVEEWIHCLSRNEIRELVITILFDWRHGSALSRSSLYSCTNLTKLELWNFKMDPPPLNFKGFLLLRSLYLHCVSLSRVGVESLFANSPLLESLTIMDCQGSDELRIRAPNLKYFSLSDDFMDVSLYAPLLTELDVELFDNNFAHENQTKGCNYVNFFADLTNLVELRGNLYFTEFLSIGIESCHYTLTFHYLKVIYLSQVDFEDTKEIAVVARLVIGAPNLHKLDVSCGITAKGSGASDICLEDLGCAPNFSLKKLKAVRMPGICYNLLGIQLVKFLLENSPVLETMDLGHINIDYHYRIVTAELLGFIRASPKAKILLT